MDLLSNNNFNLSTVNKYIWYLGEDVRHPVNENEEYLCVLRSKLGNHKFLIAPEVDVADTSSYSNKIDDLSSFIELKTSKEIKSDNDIRTLHK